MIRWLLSDGWPRPWRRHRSLDERFAAYRRLPTGLPGEAEARERRQDPYRPGLQLRRVTPGYAGSEQTPGQPAAADSRHRGTPPAQDGLSSIAVARQAASTARALP